MNERIKELVVQSGNGQFHNGKCYPHIGSRTLEDWTKFAELIIRECAEVMDKDMDHPYVSRGSILKHHFGVEL
jgi:hypothetical protein